MAQRGCPTVVLYGGSDTLQAGMMTSYTMTGDAHGDRPVYYSSVTCNYLYYFKPTMEWRVGLQVGNDDGVRVRDSALYADQINGTFLLWNGGEWIENPDVKIACSDDVPAGVAVSQSVGSAIDCMRFRLHGDAIYLAILMTFFQTTTLEFTRTDQTSGGRPVYVWDTDSRYSLHFVEREKQWIGLTTGEHRVYVKNCAMTPDQIRSPWYLRDEYGVYHVVWSVTASCVGKLCQQLMAPSNGNIYGGSSYGDVVTYHCDAGYEISGDEKRTCQSDQTWSGTQPTCVRGWFP
ncbi:PREDICTED: uncharacterized protein LOC109486989 [Branchiostoma belcheri]|uniref:Uncharacterized protein LOC109486989 n=1 Tax=Branchiostoma belcheri TaxID=7741 RepID=A0A6P4ZZD3_BRABE|nr:PREDICTED: uncharacterized protein LOC109486989 [Branchiostoma belcheri]